MEIKKGKCMHLYANISSWAELIQSVIYVFVLSQGSWLRASAACWPVCGEPAQALLSTQRTSPLSASLM